MSSLPANSLLQELSTLSAEARLSRVRGSADVDKLVVALAEEANRIVFVEAARAVEMSRLVTDLADELSCPRGQIRARRALAQAYCYTGKFGDALVVCEQALALAEAFDEQVEGARIRTAAMHAYGELAQYDDALAAGEAAWSTFRQAGEHELAARADINLGGIRLNRDEPAEALRHLDRARGPLADQPMMQGFIENNRGEALLLLNRFAAAEEAFTAALAASERAEAKLAAAIAQGNLADLAARRGRLQDALYHFEHARRRFGTDAADGHRVRLMVEQADALAALGLPDDALRCYAETLPELERLGLDAELARAEAGMGRTFLQLNRIDRAGEHLARAAEVYGRLGLATPAAFVDLVRADLALRLGDLTEAERLVDEARRVVRGRPVDEAVAQYQQGRIHQLRGAPQAAEREYVDALEVAEDAELAPLVAEILHARGQVRRQLDRREEAIADFAAAVDAVERVRGSIQAERCRAAFHGDRAALYGDLVTELLETRSTRDAARAFQVVEQAKSRVLLDLAAGVVIDTERLAARSGSDAELVRTIATLREELNLLYSRQDAAWASPAAGRGWRSQVREIEHRLSLLEQRLQSAGATLVEARAPVSIETLCDQLTAGAALVEYFMSGDEVLAFVIRPQETRVVRALAQVGDVSDALERLQFHLARALRPAALAGGRGSRLLSETQRLLRRLYELLIVPLGLELHEITQLFLVPHGVLHRLPFAALWSGERYLVEEVQLSFAPSASWLTARLRETEADDACAASALVVGVADEAAPQITQEARQIAGGFSDVSLYLNEQATADVVRDALENVRLAHIACHGRFAQFSPLSSGLKLSDRWLTVRDIYQLRLRAELVTLSGCETGRSEVGAGDEMIGLIRGFLVAGAQTVLGTLWAVHDEFSWNLMQRFYELWHVRDSGEGISAAAALRQAQCEALTANPHPVFWAPYSLVGKP